MRCSATRRRAQGHLKAGRPGRTIWALVHQLPTRCHEQLAKAGQQALRGLVDTGQYCEAAVGLLPQHVHNLKAGQAQEAGQERVGTGGGTGELG